MKLLVAVCLLSLAGLSFGDQVLYPRGCRYIMGRCVEECPEGTIAYAPGCKAITPEATCKNPNPVASKGIICDYSQCYCEPPTVKDEKTGKCVPLDKCSK